MTETRKSYQVDGLQVVQTAGVEITLAVIPEDDYYGVTVVNRNLRSDFQDRRFDTEVQARMVANQAVTAAEKPDTGPQITRSVRVMAAAIRAAKNARSWGAK